MSYTETVAEICKRLTDGGLAPHPDVKDSAWKVWLDGFGGIPERRECKACGARMVRRSGKHGDFYGCSQYPKCKETERV